MQTDTQRMKRYRGRGHDSTVFVALTFSMTMARVLAIATLHAVTLAMVLTIVWCVLLVVPALLHEVDGLATCVVLAAMLAPVLGVARRYAHVDRLAHHTHGHRLN